MFVQQLLLLSYSDELLIKLSHAFSHIIYRLKTSWRVEENDDKVQKLQNLVHIISVNFVTQTINKTLFRTHAARITLKQAETAHSHQL